jgi:3-hydroxybutyryl-CoA dehydrogenase
MIEKLENYGLNTTVRKPGTIHKVGIIGCGMIGQDVARLVSQSGTEVVFVEISEARRQEVLRSIDSHLDEIINGWGLTLGEKKIILSRIKGTVDYKDIRDCDLIIETISSEDPLEERKHLFEKIESFVSQKAIIATSVSTLMITDIATHMIHPERALSLNFFSSPATVKIVEVVRGLQTSDEAHDILCRFCNMIGKTVITVNESPGSISTRLIVTLINEACNSMVEGVSNVEDIDNIMRQGFGMQFGPFELADRIGLDKVLRYMNHLFDEFGLLKFKASPMIKRLVRANNLGRRTGKGFYVYDSEGRKTGTNVVSTQIKSNR